MLAISLACTFEPGRSYIQLWRTRLPSLSDLSVRAIIALLEATTLPPPNNDAQSANGREALSPGAFAPPTETRRIPAFNDAFAGILDDGIVQLRPYRAGYRVPRVLPPAPAPPVPARAGGDPMVLPAPLPLLAQPVVAQQARLAHDHRFPREIQEPLL